jgi:hypothetical protein
MRGYRPRSLGPTVTLVYLARVLAFRVYAFLTLRHGEVHIMNRYFYDLFAHYRIESRLERCCMWLLQHFIPKPALAIVVVASQATIATRRPEYDREYISAAVEAYEGMKGFFPDVIEIRTDLGADDAIDLESVMKGARIR